MMHEIITQLENHVGTLILNRPEKRNALSQTLLIDLHMTLKKWEESGDVWTVVIRGAGDKAFSSGFDIVSIPTNIPPDIQESLKNSNPLELALNSVKKYPYPVIAMMNGYAFGAGLNLAICCDMRIAVDTIKIGMPPAKLGLVYHPEGLKQFMEVVGISKAKELFFTARTYSATQAKDMAIVDYLIPNSDLLAFTYDMARDITSNAPLSICGTKKIFNMLTQTNFQMSEPDTNEAERLIVEAFNSDDLKEGQMAFLEKRKPCFKGC
jgi:enoyl-CoA hydratase/carnithine racemase